MTNFGASKKELNLKYRLGLELALAKADFLIVSDIVLVQAFVIFLLLLRRHDSPRFVWMMTGIAIRMGQALGLQRDGSNFEHLTPYEIEMRRRTWWGLVMVDIRASEDQGTEFSITSGSFDTKLPLNINNVDLSPDTKETPPEVDGLADTTFARVSYAMIEIMREMMAPGVKEGPPGLPQQARLLEQLSETFEKGYLQYATNSDDIERWVGVTVTRLVIAKMNLYVYLPALFSSPNEQFSEEIRNKLLICALEVAECNHAVNAETRCRQWRWVFQTYTHWHAIVYLFIEVSRRQWSPVVERAWIALQSKWLIPAQGNMNRNSRVWLPLRKLMAKGLKNREAEIQRLCNNPAAIEQLELADHNILVPTSPGPFPPDKAKEIFREHWRSLFKPPTDPGQPLHHPTPSDLGVPYPSSSGTESEDPQNRMYEQHAISANNNLDPGFLDAGAVPMPNVHMEPQLGPSFTQLENVADHNLAQLPADWLTDPTVYSDVSSWLWTDPDPSLDVYSRVDANMDVDNDMNWSNWLDSTKDIM
jgi:hypothetical protein